MNALKQDTAGYHHRVIDPAAAEGSENTRGRERGHRKAKGKGNVRRLKFEEAFPTQGVYRGDPEERTGSAGLRLGKESCWSRACGNVGLACEKTWS